MTTDTGERVHVERAGVVGMALSAEEAFSLFSAEGERRWQGGTRATCIRSSPLRERAYLRRIDRLRTTPLPT